MKNAYNAFGIVKEFEHQVALYTGAPYCVAVNSCTNALFLALRYNYEYGPSNDEHGHIVEVEIPKHTYISVPMQIKHAGFDVRFRNEKWKGIYQLKPFQIYDAARRFTANMYGNPIGGPHKYVCVSFHWSKILGVQQGGAILHNDSEFDAWARRARFDGRTEGVPPNKDKFATLGWHMYMSPEIAALGLVRLMHLPDYNKDLPNDDYPDLSKIDWSKL